VEWLVWAALGVAVVVVVAALARVIQRAADAWRSYTRFRRALGRQLYALETGAARLAEEAAKARPSPELERSLARLAESRARLSALRRAVDDVTGPVATARALYPRK
jgi:type II secretory pathway component PulK